MNMPTFTAEAAAFPSHRRYRGCGQAGSLSSRVEPQAFCEPCRDGRQQCYGYTGSRCYHVCRRGPLDFEPICYEYCTPGEFGTWSQPCGGIVRPPE
jgi:hypothetical protein